MGAFSHLIRKREIASEEDAETEIASEEDAEIVVNIEDDQLDEWDKLIRNELDNTPTPSSEEEPGITIPRVPQRLRYKYNKAYNPRIIAIGPYHLDEHNLKPMEKHKWQLSESDSLAKYRSLLEGLH